MGYLAIAAMLAGTAISAVGAAKQGEAQKSAAQANARLSAMDAANEQELIARRAYVARGVNITRIAKSGVTESGSPLDVLFTNELEAKRQVDAIQRSQRAYANMQYKIGQNAVEASRWAIAGSVLSGIGSAAGGSGFSFATQNPGGWGNSRWDPSVDFSKTGTGWVNVPLRRSGS